MRCGASRRPRRDRGGAQRRHPHSATTSRRSCTHIRSGVLLLAEAGVGGGRGRGGGARGAVADGYDPVCASGRGSASRGGYDAEVSGA